MTASCHSNGPVNRNDSILSIELTEISCSCKLACRNDRNLWVLQATLYKWQNCVISIDWLVELTGFCYFYIPVWLLKSHGWSIEEGCVCGHWMASDPPPPTPHRHPPWTPLWSLLCHHPLGGTSTTGRRLAMVFCGLAFPPVGIATFCHFYRQTRL